MHTIGGGGEVCVKLNDNMGKYFPTDKGMRQGDSISPLIFDMVADALAILMNMDKASGLVKGVLEENTDKGTNMLRYVDDTIFLIQDDFESAHNFYTLFV